MLGELYWLRGKPIGLPQSQYLSLSQYHKKSISKMKFGIFITFGITYAIVLQRESEGGWGKWSLFGWEGMLVGRGGRRTTWVSEEEGPHPSLWLVVPPSPRGPTRVASESTRGRSQDLVKQVTHSGFGGKTDVIEANPATTPQRPTSV